MASSSGSRNPKKVPCVECGADVYSFQPRALCADCIRATGRKVCACRFPDWEPLACEIHWGFNPFDIPY